MSSLILRQYHFSATSLFTSKANTCLLPINRVDSLIVSYTKEARS